MSKDKAINRRMHELAPNIRVPQTYNAVSKPTVSSINEQFKSMIYDEAYNKEEDYEEKMDLNELDKLAKRLVKNPKYIKKLARMIQDEVELLDKKEYADDCYKAIISNYLKITKEDVDKGLILTL